MSHWLRALISPEKAIRGSGYSAGRILRCRECGFDVRHDHQQAGSSGLRGLIRGDKIDLRLSVTTYTVRTGLVRRFRSECGRIYYYYCLIIILIYYYNRGFVVIVLYYSTLIHYRERAIRGKYAARLNHDGSWVLV